MFVRRNCFEWIHTIKKSGHKVLCCPEDVRFSSEIGFSCQIPLCNDCMSRLDNGTRDSNYSGSENCPSNFHRSDRSSHGGLEA
eukprot:10005388-Karenia_brevis.AAC.1